MNIIRKIILIALLLVVATKMLHSMIVKTIHIHELEEIHPEECHLVTDRREKIIAI
ncbi:MAG: hypothetical protein WD068_01850 [Candidatus Babeliales bacterium]